GALTQGLSGIAGALEDILAEVPLIGSLVNVDIDDVSASVNLDLPAVLDPVLSEPLIDDDGTVSIDLTEGTIRLDLSTLYDLNNLDPTTRLLSDTAINSTIDAAIEDLITNELPTRIADVLREALDTSELEASVAVSVSTGIPPAAVPIG